MLNIYLLNFASCSLIFSQVGFGWALRICGFICLGLTAGAAIMVRGRLPRRTGSDFFAFDLFRLPAYCFFWSVHHNHQKTTRSNWYNPNNLVPACSLSFSVLSIIFFPKLQSQKLMLGSALGLFFLIFYLPSYGAVHGFSPNMIFYSISILNAASFVRCPFLTCK